MVVRTYHFISQAASKQMANTQISISTADKQVKKTLFSTTRERPNVTMKTHHSQKKKKMESSMGHKSKKLSEFFG